MFDFIGGYRSCRQIFENILRMFRRCSTRQISRISEDGRQRSIFPEVTEVDAEEVVFPKIFCTCFDSARFGLVGLTKMEVTEDIRSFPTVENKTDE